MTPLPTPADLMRAQYSTLTAKPSSEHCSELCDVLLGKLMHQEKRRPNHARRRAFAALIGDLLERDPEDHGGWLYRILSPNDFTGGAVGYRPFVAVLTHMKGHMVDFVGGTQQYTVSSLTEGKRQPTWGRGARFRATDWLRKWFAEQGITRETWSQHFVRERRKTPPNQSSVTVRAMKARRGSQTQYGRSLSIDLKNPNVAAIKGRMDRLNAFLWEQTIEPHGPAFLRRIFANGDQPGFCWQTGGRLTALGKDTYQTAKKLTRASILINGKETVEIDIQASHLTILVGLGLLPRETLTGDPYEIDGIPRDLVKGWVVMELGYGKRHKRWPKSLRVSFNEKHGSDLSREFPLQATGDAILAKLPIFGTEGTVVPVGWGQLQYLESEALMKAMEVLAYDHQIASLPVHDSLIVPKDKKELAIAALKTSFMEIVGVEPVVH